MDTRRLFKEDVYLKTAKAVITDIQREEENLVLILDQTIFFPEGGGQSSDIGTISDLTVTHVYEDKDYIYHRCVEKESELSIGEIGRASCRERVSMFV